MVSPKFGMWGLFDSIEQKQTLFSGETHNSIPCQYHLYLLRNPKSTEQKFSEITGVCIKGERIGDITMRMYLMSYGPMKKKVTYV